MSLKEVIDKQWSKIKFLFNNCVKVGRPSLNPRTVINAIMWIMKSGGRWRSLFERLLKIINAGTRLSVR